MIASWIGSRWMLVLLVAALLTWLALGPVMGFSELWYRLADAPVFWISLLVAIFIQRSQDKEMAWMEERLADLEEEILGRRPDSPRDNTP